MILLPEISGNYQQKYTVAKKEKLGYEMAVEFCLWTISFILVGFFNMQ
jgi:hypothetical protein